MNFLKRLFSGGESSEGRQAGDPKGMYFYVRSNRCDEVIQVRLDRANDLSIQDYTPTTYYTRKLIVGTKCFDRMEAEFTFDANRRLIEKSVQGGTFVEYEDYQAYMEKEAAQATEAQDA
jgi:hypothetical protein